jgi:hypothetical protein
MAVSQVDRLKNPCRGVDVEALGGDPAAAQRPGDADQASEDQACVRA